MSEPINEESKNVVEQTNPVETAVTQEGEGAGAGAGVVDIENKKRKSVSSFGPVPEGMSKSQWKKICRKKQWESEKDEYREFLRVKRLNRRSARRAKIGEFIKKGEEIPEHLKKKPRRPIVEQTKSGIKIIIDCAFDSLMNEKEIISLSNQIVRSFSANRNYKYYADLQISSFDKRLKSRFDGKLTNTRYAEWKNVKFNTNDILLNDISDEEKTNGDVIYLSSDATETLETLETNKTYIVGGIVDKGRYKKLCLNKAQELGIQTRKLPIGDFIKLNGRKVLTTTHVVELMLKYFETRNWKESFESVLPQRKLGPEKTKGDGEGDEDSDGEDSDGEEEQEEEAQEEEQAEEEVKVDEEESKQVKPVDD